jgi:NUMOD4 motif/NUMOD1 domain
MKKYPYRNTELKSLKGEKWKDIPGFEMYFKVSNFGRIKRLEYEMQYSDGRIYVKPSKIIKPVLVSIPNEFMNDNIYFLRSGFTLHKQKYNFSIARLVYHRFKEAINLDDEAIIILTKDGDGRNIKPSNLQLASRSQKQQRMCDLHRRKPLEIDTTTRAKIIEKLKLVNSKQVSQYTMQGKKIKTYPSAAIASQKTGISQSHISNRAGGTEFSAGGFIWRFGNAPVVDINPMLELIEQRRIKNKEVFGTKVSQYNMDGNRLAVYSTISDAAKAIGISKANITSVIYQKGLSAGGYYWLKGNGPAKIDLSGYEYGEALRHKNRRRPIRQFSKAGEPLQKFESIKAAAENVGVAAATIVGALSGRQKTSGGFKWKYL